MISMKDFKPANVWAQQYGCKTVAYGPPGIGKTPVFDTAPRPLLAFTEPGMLSMRKSTIPSIKLDTTALIDDFFAWLASSAETKNFDTIGFDSGSQTAEIYLAKYLGGSSKAGNKVDGRAAYGDMARVVMEKMIQLYYMPYKHIYIICKEEIKEVGNVNMRRPYFPGKDLNIKIPHLFDLILHQEKAMVPGQNGMVTAFRTAASFDTIARDRSGNLDELEPPNLTRLFAKVMQ